MPRGSSPTRFQWTRTTAGWVATYAGYDLVVTKRKGNARKAWSWRVTRDQEVIMTGTGFTDASARGGASQATRKLVEALEIGMSFWRLGRYANYERGVLSGTD